MHDFSVTIPRYYKDAYVNSFLPRTARINFKSRINKHLLTVASF